MRHTEQHEDYSFLFFLLAGLHDGCYSEVRDIKSRRRQDLKKTRGSISNKRWLLTFDHRLQGLESLTHAESWEHLFKRALVFQQQAGSIWQHHPPLYGPWQPLWVTAQTLAAFEPRRRSLGRLRDAWTDAGRLPSPTKPLGSRRVQMWHYLKLHWGLTFPLIFHLFFFPQHCSVSKPSTFFLLVYALIECLSLTLCTDLFCVIHLVLKNPTHCGCNTLKLYAPAFLHRRPALLPSTLRRRAVFAETLATPLI